MKLLFALLLVGLAVVGRAQEGMRIPLPSAPVSYTWKLGEHRRSVAFELEREARVQFGDDRMRVTILHTHPQLYAKLLESLRSNAKGGFTRLVQDGKTEVFLGQVSELSVITDSKGGVWIQGDATLRIQRAGLLAKTQVKKLAVGFATGVQNGVFKLVPQIVSIQDVPSSAEQKLLSTLPTVQIPLPDCLQDKNVKMERITMAAKSNTLLIAATLDSMSLSEIGRCVAEIAQH